MKRIKNRALNALRYVLGPCRGTVEWNLCAPPGINFATHKFSVIDAFESSTYMLRTDPSKQVEQVIIGLKFFTVIKTLPHFIAQTSAASGLLPRIKDLIKVGQLGNREIMLSMRKSADCLAVLGNGKEHVRIKMVEKPHKGAPGIGAWTALMQKPRVPKRK